MKRIFTFCLSGSPGVCYRGKSCWLMTDIGFFHKHTSLQWLGGLQWLDIYSFNLAHVITMSSWDITPIYPSVLYNCTVPCYSTGDNDLCCSLTVPGTELGVRASKRVIMRHTSLTESWNQGNMVSKFWETLPPLSSRPPLSQSPACLYVSCMCRYIYINL